jgi:hypothetical protein
MTGIIQSPNFTVLTVDVQPIQFDFAIQYEDGIGGSSTVLLQLIQDDSSVETVLQSDTYSTGSGLTTIQTSYTLINLNPSPTKFYFWRLTVPIPTMGQSSYGTIADGLTFYCLALGEKLEEVSDPIEYFNVYGNCFFQENVLIHATQTLGNPAVPQYSTVYDYNQIQLLSPSFLTSILSGQIQVVSGPVSTLINNYSLQVNYPAAGLFSRLEYNSFIMNETTQNARIYTNEFVTITPSQSQKGSLKLGILELNHNTNGSQILLKKDSISVATDTISIISSQSKDSVGTPREFSRITTRASAVGPGNQDGTLAISNLINGVLVETFNFNGNDNEINSFRPLDMNGQSVKTSSGNLLLSAVSSTGTGHFTIEPKSATGDLIFNGNNIQSATSGGNSGQHLRIKLNGVYYKIALQQDT